MCDFFGGFFQRARPMLRANQRNAKVNVMSTGSTKSSTLLFYLFIIIDTNMTSKRTKEHKEIQYEVISKEDILDRFNRLVNLVNDMRKWTKEAKSNRRKDREEKMHLGLK